MAKKIVSQFKSKNYFLWLKTYWIFFQKIITKKLIRGEKSILIAKRHFYFLLLPKQHVDGEKIVKANNKKLIDGLYGSFSIWWLNFLYTSFGLHYLDKYNLCICTGLLKVSVDLLQVYWTRNKSQSLVMHNAHLFK